MHRIGRGGDKIKFPVEAPGLLVLGVHRKRPNAGNVGRLDGALHRVAQKSLSDTLAVPASIHRQTCQQHYGHRMTRQPLGKTFGSFLASNLANSERVIADDGIRHQANIGLCRSRLLVSPGVPQQIPVEFLPATVKFFYRMFGAELFDAAGGIH